MPPYIAINIVTWNSLPYLRFCLESIKQQTLKNFSILIIDNASTDGTLEFLEKQYPEITVIKNTANLGFARAHNQGIHHLTLPSPYQGEGGGEVYLLILNPDVILTPDYLEKIATLMEQEPEAAGITGRLLRYTFDEKSQIPNPKSQINPNDQNSNSQITNNSLSIIHYSDIIDSDGLEILKTRKVRERNAGKSTLNYKLKATSYDEVFGISGACALYRLPALEQAKLPIIRKNSPPYPRQTLSSSAPNASSEYFDENFENYKEDIDLSWRLRLLGWKFLFTPEAIAFHHRAIGEEKQREKRSPLINYWSYRNHLYLLLKNEQGSNFLRHAPWILGYEFSKFLYCLLFEPRTLKGLWDFCKNAKTMLRKRQVIMARSKTKASEIRRWFK
jgi:GT2 family glycosyltransferase